MAFSTHGSASGTRTREVTPGTRSAASRLVGSRAAWISLGFIASLCILALVAPAFVPEERLFQISDDVLRPPSLDHLLGTDDLGRSVALQVIWGARISLAVGIVSALAAAAIGTLIGALSGYAGRAVDTVVMRATEVFQVMPTFVLAALIVALAGPGETRVMAVIAGLAWPQTARVVRGEVLRLKTLGFVEASRCLGIPEWRILAFEIVPSLLAPVIAIATLTAASAILLEAALSFFGLTSPDTVSWGLTLGTGQRLLYQAWWLSAFPGLAILATALAFNVFGDCLRDALDPRDRNG